MESPRRGLLNYMSEHRPILKNNQNTHYSLIFLDTFVQPHELKAFAETFLIIWLNIGLS